MNPVDSASAIVFCEEIIRKNDLLKRLNTLYTKVLDLIDSKKYDELDSELDAQNALIAEIGGSSPSCDYNSLRDKADAYLSECGTDEVIYPILTKAAEGIETYGRLLKNCGVLCEKLAYRVKEAKNESELFILAQKNRKLIKSGYNSSYSLNTGTFVDCKIN